MKKYPSHLSQTDGSRYPIAESNWLQFASQNESALESKILPDIITRVRIDVREVLKKSEVPEFLFYSPKITSVDTLFEEGRNCVLDCFIATPDSMQTLCNTMAELNNDSEFSSETFFPAEIENIIRTRSMDGLQGRLSSTAWRYWTMVAAEIQYAQMIVLRHWLKDETCRQKIESFGVKSEHAQFLLQLSSTLGKWIDQAFLKQIWLHEDTKKAEAHPSPGKKFAYDMRDGQALPFSDLFAKEFGGTERSFDVIRKQIPSDIERDYPLFAQYLEKLSEALKSKNVEGALVEQLWDEVSELAVKVYRTGCPIFIKPYAVPGESGKMEIEFHMGLREPQYSDVEKIISDHDRSAQNIFNKYAAEDNEISFRDIPPTLTPSNLLGFGVNVTWYLDAEMRRQCKILFPNVIDRMSEEEMRRIEKYFDVDLVDLKKFQQAQLLEANTHESAHCIYHYTDPVVNKRTGQSHFPVLASSLEELKAETVGAKIIYSQLDEMDFEQQKCQVAAKISSIKYYITQKKEEQGGRYYDAAKVMLHHLLQGQAIHIQEDGRISVPNAKNFFQLLANLGDELISKYYRKPNSENTSIEFGNEILKADENVELEKCLQAMERIYNQKLAM